MNIDLIINILILVGLIAACAAVEEFFHLRRGRLGEERIEP